MLKILQRLITEEEGQGMVEYGLILALIAVVLIGLLTAIGGNLEDIFTTIRDALGGGS
ncbi:Flp family type IVb pilin [Sporohalobacter salinus]|uniref:Flp family type IVb pilin n=1 Tax=Sporohalobacter salinus TaxID=1494606 RepID=UPI001961BED3|nr:Flp family type IVb pilin [Sporohalobacter salinus]MBM7623012.1 pilus assembly protein Flp/PilA [Sporohalobacter salinus]